MKQSMRYEIDCFRTGLIKLFAALMLFFMLQTPCFILSAKAQGNVGIGTTSPNASALLDLTSLSRGLLVPRMLQSQRNAISSPATGLLVFCTDSVSPSFPPNTFYYYNGTAWLPFLGAGWLILGNSGTTPTNDFVGTRDSEDLVIRTNNLEHLRVYAAGNVGLTNTNNTAEELRFFEPSGSGTTYTGFKAGVQSGSVTYIFPPADGSSSQVLCTDGSGDLSWRTFGTVGGGGIDTLWARGTASGALIGVGLSNIASGIYSLAAGYNTTSSGSYAAAFGYQNVASGTAAAISGGEQDSATGNYSTIGGGQDNVASGNYSSMGGGQTNKACGTYSSVVGGYENTACGNYSTVLGGQNNSVSGNYSMAFGLNATVTQDSSVVFYTSAGGLKVGIGNAAPTEALDVTGNLKFSGALMPNNLAGTSGYVLASTGSTTAPIWSAASNLYWSTLGNTGTNSTTNYLGTTDAKDFAFRTTNTERMRILSTGQIGIGVTTTTHQLHSLYTGTTDETAAIYGNASGSTANQAIGIWGAATNTSSANTGTIGALATGNGNTTAGQTNVAVQLNDGEFAMGRTTEAPSEGTSVEPAASGTAYSAQGPSGVIELTLDSVNLYTLPPTAGVFQNLGTLTINNQFCTATSIVIVNIVQKITDGNVPDCTQADYFVDVDYRTAGAFNIRVGMIPTITSTSNYSTADMIKVGYVIINPGR
jgi:hypothetical protein